MPPTRSTTQSSFLAIDFETATPDRSSACAVGLVLVENGVIVANAHYLVRPPQKNFHWACVQTHGITYDQVSDAGTFADLWLDVRHLFTQAEYVAAHNAAFDRSVLERALQWYRLRPLANPFACTMRLAKDSWGLRPAKLPDVCRAKRIALPKHHDALEDAWACARIMIRGQREGIAPPFLT